MVGGGESAVAQGHLRASLSALGLEVEERVTPLSLLSGDVKRLVHLEVLLPGASSDRFVLLAPYGNPHIRGAEADGGPEDLSGAALLLELTRALSQRQLPYSIQVLFLEGEGSPWQGDGLPARGTGSRLLAASMAERGEFEGIRLLVAFDRVCGAGLRIARDLRSQRHHRERFWRVARELGYAQVFPPDRGFESVDASHRPFAELGLRPVLAIVDSTYGRSEEPGESSAAPQDVIVGCAAESLEVVGVVSLASLLAIGEQLERIDRFASQPVITEDGLTAAVSPSAPADPDLSQ